MYLMKAILVQLRAPRKAWPHSGCVRGSAGISILSLDSRVLRKSAEACFCLLQSMEHFVLPPAPGASDHKYPYTAHPIVGGLARSLCPGPTSCGIRCCGDGMYLYKPPF